ncbi:YjcZ family sporulation protein [Sporosarcina sp. ACRSL]|nr:YjcZ family sporulation protein [Sporosarcina sp. ACRSL]MCG7345948.1 YjcZ family sporulation protein [Sporosarcina sp. ACRSL]
MSDKVVGVGYGGGFTLIVVLFILLIIVGVAYVDGGFYY